MVKNFLYVRVGYKNKLSVEFWSFADIVKFFKEESPDNYNHHLNEVLDLQITGVYNYNSIEKFIRIGEV